MIGLENEIIGLQNSMNKLTGNINNESANLHHLQDQKNDLEHLQKSQQTVQAQIPDVKRSVEDEISKIDEFTKALVKMKDVAASLFSHMSDLRNNALVTTHESFLKKEFVNSILDICLFDCDDEPRKAEIRLITDELISQYGGKGIPLALQTKADDLEHKLAGSLAPPPQTSAAAAQGTLESQQLLGLKQRLEQAKQLEAAQPSPEHQKELIAAQTDFNVVTSLASVEVLERAKLLPPQKSPVPQQILAAHQSLEQAKQILAQRELDYAKHVAAHEQEQQQQPPPPHLEHQTNGLPIPLPTPAAPELSLEQIQQLVTKLNLEYAKQLAASQQSSENAKQLAEAQESLDRQMQQLAVSKGLKHQASQRFVRFKINP